MLLKQTQCTSIKVGLSPSKFFFCYFLHWQLVRNDENCFLFHVKAIFILKIFQFLVTTFWSCRKNSLIRKIRLISNYMTSQPGWHTFVIHILHNISKSKGSCTIVEQSCQRLLNKRASNGWRIMPVTVEESCQCQNN